MSKSCYLTCLSILLSLSFFFGCMPKRNCIYEPKLASINILDRNGFSETISSEDRLNRYITTNFLEPQPYEKVLRVYAKDLQGQIPAFITSYHLNGLPRQYLEVVNGRASGVYKEWFENGVQKVEGFVISGEADLTEAAQRTWLFDGESKAWNDKGQLVAVILYNKGEQEGVSYFYHPNGNVWKSIPYVRDRIHGELNIYFEDGSLLQKCEYSLGVPSGKLVRFWDAEKVSSNEIYSDGSLIEGEYYDPLGGLISKIVNGEGYRVSFTKDGIAEIQEYHEGVLDGKVKLYNKQNRLHHIYHVKNGIRHGEEIAFYESSKLNSEPLPKLSIQWYDGRIHGVVKTWYENGVQESQREITNNKKNGVSTAWYKEGSLMMIEEYENDKLVRGEYFSKGDKFPVSEVQQNRGIATIYDSEGTFVRRIVYLNGKPQLDGI